jgi:hypothetical protein
MSEYANEHLLTTASGEATNRALCTTCGEVFSTDANFDRHLSKGRSREGYDGPWCRPPDEVGLLQDGRGVWRQPGPQERPEGRTAMDRASTEPSPVPDTEGGDAVA